MRSRPVQQDSDRCNETGGCYVSHRHRPDDSRCKHGIREDDYCPECQLEESPSAPSAVNGVLNRRHRIE